MFEDSFAIIENNVIIEYPVDPRYKLVYVSFPENWQGGVIEGIEFVKVDKTPKPKEKFGWQIIEGVPSFNKKTNYWIQNWSKRYMGHLQLKKLISEIRYKKEISGLKIDGYVFKTDRDSQTKYTLMALNNVKTNWKINDEQFVYVDMKYIDEKVRKYVHDCFETEHMYFEIVDSKNMMIIENTEFESGWPDNEQE
jgi:hypothetical protein